MASGQGHPPANVTITYQHFRKQAFFDTDHADFVVDEHGLRQLLADVELLWGASGLGTGDVTLLARSAAGLPAFASAISGCAAPAAQRRQGALGHSGLVLTYAAVTRVCQILRERASRVRKDAWEILSPDSQQADQDSQAHTRSAAQGQGSQLERYITAFSGNQTAAHKTQMQDTKPETQHQGTFVPPKWWDTELPGRHPVRSDLPVRPTTADPSVREWEGHSTAHTHAQQGTSLLNTLPAQAHQLLTQHPHAAAAALHTQAASEPHVSTGATQSTGASQLKWTRRRLTPHTFSGRLLQEVVRRPECEFPAVARMISGIKALRDEGARHAHLVLLELKSLVSAWEAALQEKAAKAAMRGNKGGAEDTQQGVCAQLRGEGLVWVLLTTASTLMVQSKPLAAEKTLETAREALESDGLGQHHSYVTALDLCQGSVYYHLGRYEEAAATWGRAASMGTHTARTTLDPLTQRNAAAAANNQGCALLMLGDRAGAVRCFRAAVCALRHAAHEGVMSQGQELSTHQVQQYLPPPLTATAPAPATAGKAPGSPTRSLQTPLSPSPVPTAQPTDTEQQASEGQASVPSPDPTVQPPAIAADAASSQQPAAQAAAAEPAPPAKAKAGGKGGAQKASAGPPPPQGLDAPAAQVCMYNLQGALKHAFAVGAPPVLQRPATAHSASRTTAAGATTMQSGNTAGPQVWSPAPDHPLTTYRATHRPQTAHSLAGQLTGRPLSASVQGSLQTSQSASSLRRSLARPLSATLGASLQCLSGVGLTGSNRTGLIQSGEGDSTSLAARTGPLRTFLTGAITARPATAPAAPPAYATRATAASMEGKGKGKGKGDKGGKGDGKKKGDKGKKKKGEKGFQITYDSNPYYDTPIYSVANVKAEAPKKKKAPSKMKKK